MHKKFKRIVPFIVSMSLLLGINIPQTKTYAQEDDTEELEKIIEASLGENEIIDDAFDPQPVDKTLVSDTYSVDVSELTSYISPYVTSIKNQNPYGTCWAHAVCSVAEANVVKTYNEQEPDFSEWQIAYFIGRKYVQDPMNNTVGDSYVSIPDQYLEIGGNQQLAAIRLASWNGVVDEELAPYSTVVADSEATLDDSLAYDNNEYILTGCDFIPYSDIDTVKQAIYENGAVTGSYRHDPSYYSTSDYWYASEPVAEYCPASVSTTTNHAITVIGWDDNYSADNFTGSYKPSNNGAWICKNSWSSNWSKDGIFYISYEDGPLSNGTAYSHKYSKASEYTYNYHYDGGVTSTYRSVANEANIYTATSAQKLKAVGFFTRTANYIATISVYKNCTPGNPISGELVSIVEDELVPCAGYHTVLLEDEVLLSEGDVFSVVINYEETSGVGAYVIGDKSQTGSWYTSVAVAHDGESFTSIDGVTWSCWDKNTRIKAFAVDAEETYKEEILAGNVVLTEDAFVYAGEAIEPDVTVKNADGTELREGTDYTVSFSNNNKTGYASVTVKGKNNYFGEVTKKFKIMPDKTSITKMSNEVQGVLLQWNTVDGAVGYKIYGRQEGGVYKLVAGASSGSRYYVLDKTAVNTDVYYQYKIIAVGNDGVISEASTAAKIYRLPRPSMTSLKNNVSGGFTAAWKPISSATGYEIRYSTSEDFNSYVSVSVPSTASATKTIKNLKAGTTYYVKIRSKKKEATVTYGSAWGSVIKVKIAK